MTIVAAGSLERPGTFESRMVTQPDRRAPTVRRPCLAACTALLLFVGCDDEPGWLRVERIDPAAGPDGIAPIAINQELVVHFSEPIDPTSVTRESVRVRDESGQPVRGELIAGARSIRFRPEPPLAAALDDGSFRAGGRYRLELSGMPTSFAVCSRRGRPLETGIACLFRVPEDPAELGLPTPFLPVDSGEQPTRLDLAARPSLRMAADTGLLELRFTAPVLPSSVRPSAFHFARLVDAPKPETVVPTQCTVRSITSATGFAGTVVELQFADAVDLDTRLYLVAFEAGDGGLVDYRGRKVEALPEPMLVKIDPGARVRLLDVELAELELFDDPAAVLGFEVRGRRIVAGGFVEAGSGVDGPLSVTTAATIAPGAQLARADGSTSIVGPGGLELTALEVAPGAELRLAADPAATLVVRVVGDIRIAGRVILAGGGRNLSWRSGDRPAFESLLRAAGIALVAGGDVQVAAGAEIVVEGGSAGRNPMVVVVAGDLRSDAPLPPGCAFALQHGRRVHGIAEKALWLDATLTPGLPEGGQSLARSWTQWLPLPAGEDQAFDVSLHDPRGGIEASVQIARPHAFVEQRPIVDEAFLPAPVPLPLREPLVAPPGAYFRVLLEGVVRGAAVPSIGGFALHRRSGAR